MIRTTCLRGCLGVLLTLGMLILAPQAWAATPTYTISSFTARGWAEASPADVSVAVGQTYVVETINTSITVYAKGGSQTYHDAFGEFFIPATGVFCPDPVVIYNAPVNRYALVCTDTANNTVRFAVSETGDPNGAWGKWNTGPGTGVDQPSVEITKNKLIVAGSNALGTAIWVYQLSDIIAGAATPRVTALQVPRGQYRAVNQITTTGTGYLAQAYPFNDVFLGRVTGAPANNNVAWSETDLGPDTLAPPHEPSIPGGFLGGGHYLDGRVLNASYEVTSTGAKIIEFSQITACGSGNLDCIGDGRVTITTSGPTLTYLKSYGSSTHDETYGAVVVDGSGQPLEVYTRSSPTQGPQAAIRSTGLNRVVRNATSGTTACHTGATPPCDERWGDYLGAARDPSNASRVWLAGLYQTASGDDGWKTVISSVTVTG
jgi:hypothetical protein